MPTVCQSDISNMSDTRLNHLKTFYELISRLSQLNHGPRRLSQCTGRMDWPDKGVYFFQEAGEYRDATGTGLRVVRVGTHALKEGSGTNLWNRLSQHRGRAASKGGNNRGSIFRLLVGTALIAKNGQHYPTWGQGSSAPRAVRESETPLELIVSETIGHMPFFWLRINDQPGPQSLRGYIERNAIALLSNYNRSPLDPPSQDWLGHWCDRKRINGSGLWNSNHVDDDYDLAFLDTMEKLIEEMASLP